MIAAMTKQPESTEVFSFRKHWGLQLHAYATTGSFM